MTVVATGAKVIDTRFAMQSAALVYMHIVAGSAARPLPPQQRHAAGYFLLIRKPVTTAASHSTSRRRRRLPAVPAPSLALQEDFGGLGASARRHAGLQRRLEVVELEALACDAAGRPSLIKAWFDLSVR